MKLAVETEKSPKGKMTRKELVWSRIIAKFNKIGHTSDSEILANFILSFGVKSFASRDKLFASLRAEKYFKAFLFTWLFATTQVFAETLDNIEKRLKQIENALKTE